MKHLTKEDWEKEFEKQYPFWNSGCKCMEEPTEPATQDIKSFIKSTIEKEKIGITNIGRFFGVEHYIKTTDKAVIDACTKYLQDHEAKFFHESTEGIFDKIRQDERKKLREMLERIIIPCFGNVEMLLTSEEKIINNTLKNIVELLK